MVDAIESLHKGIQRLIETYYSCLTWIKKVDGLDENI